MPSKPAMLIALPTGLTTGGVQVWAARMVNALAARGRGAGLILHHSEERTLDLAIDPRVQVTHVPVLRPLSLADGDLAPYLPAYERAVGQLFATTGRPVVCIPCHLGDCAGLFAWQTQRAPSRLRVVGWCHSGIPYDARVVEWYQAVMGHVGAVSDHLAATLRSGGRLGGVKVWSIANGVELGASPRAARAGGPLRLMYVGRLSRDIKRVMALVSMSDELDRTGIEHHLTIVGDGPASRELDAGFAARAVTRVPVAGPARVAALMDSHDIFVLPSRVEGLSLAMLEAMAHGCVPVVSRTESGCGQVIDGLNGLIVDVATSAGEEETGVAMARGVAAAAEQLGSMSARAVNTIRERFSMDRHVELVEQLLDAAGSEPARSWPMDRPCAFTAPDLSRGSGAVPADGAERLAGLLQSLDGRRIILHGTGRHTIELAHVIESFRDRIIGFTDDDPTRHGQRVQGLPIVAPAFAGEAGATDVIISSWMNQDLIWNGRGEYERQRLRVHRIYPAAA